MRRGKRSGIYAIQCIDNDSWYVGQSVDMEKRWKEHLSELRKGIHRNGRLQNNYNKHGEQSLVFHNIESCEIKLLTQREQFWYDYFKDTLHRDMCNFGDFVDNPFSVRQPDAQLRREMTAAYSQWMKDNLDGSLSEFMAAFKLEQKGII